MAYPTKVNLLPAGRMLVITADALSSGELNWQDSDEAAASIGVDTVQRFGPFRFARQYTLTHITGELAEAQEHTNKDTGTAGMQANLTTIPDTENLTIPADSQVVIYDDMTINGTLDVDGVLKII
jgi:hypothetical protein